MSETPEYLSIQQLDTKLDLLIEQNARLIERLTKFRVTMQEGFTNLDASLDRIADVAERQSPMIERQSLVIERLVLILKKQVGGEG